MVVHMALVVPLKLKAVLSCTTPVVSGLILPFLIKLSFSFGIVRRSFSDVAHASRLFFFQLDQINRSALDDPDRADRLDRHEDSGPIVVRNNYNNTRLERAIRLVHRTVTTHVRQSQTFQLDEDSMHTLSMIAL